jgi:hydroxypyruvate reductase
VIEDGAAGKMPETPKILPARHTAHVISSNRIAVEAAMREASACGFAPLLLTTFLAGEAREAGRLIAQIAREARATSRPVAAPACIIAGGETTVTVRGKGKGGRNQEIALAAAIELAGETGVLVASLATDGRDGTSTAAGGYASTDTLAAGRRACLDPRACLADNDSHSFLFAAGDCIFTGPTGTNVNDITFALIEGPGEPRSGG